MGWLKSMFEPMTDPALQPKVAEVAPPPGPTRISTAMDYAEVLAYLRLPAHVSTRDGAFHKFWMPATTPVPEVQGKNYQSVEIINAGSSVAVEMNGKTLGKLDQRCLPDAVTVLRHYGGKRAPAVLSHTGEGKTYSIMCVDPDWDGQVLS